MQIQSLSASRFWITSLKPVYENGARPDSSTMFNGSVERKEITKHHVWILKKTRFQLRTLCYLQDLHLWMAEFLSTRPGPGRWFERATVSGSLWHARAAGGHTGMDISIGEREHLNRKPWFSHVLPIKLNGDLCEKLPLNQSNAYFGGWHS